MADPAVKLTAEQQEILKLALREAFNAGFEQGHDEATAYDWNQPPRQSRQEAFTDLFADWNTESVSIRALLDALKDEGEASHGAS